MNIPESVPESELNQLRDLIKQSATQTSARHRVPKTRPPPGLNPHLFKVGNETFQLSSVSSIALVQRPGFLVAALCGTAGFLLTIIGDATVITGLIVASPFCLLTAFLWLQSKVVRIRLINGQTLDMVPSLGGETAAEMHSRLESLLVAHNR